MAVPTPDQYGQIFNRVNRPSVSAFFPGRASGRVGPGVSGAIFSDVLNSVTYQALVTPEGFRQTWTDGRLNPLRGIRNKNYGLQQLGGAYPKPTRNYTGQYIGYPGFEAIPANQLHGASGQSATANRSSVTSTRTLQEIPSQPVATQTRVTVGRGHTFVQVGQFTPEQAARATIARLQQTGLPTKKLYAKRMVKRRCWC